MNPISLFTTIQTDKKGSERNELVKWFVDRLEDKNHKPFPARRIAVKLSHLNKAELENFKGDCGEIYARRGQVAMNKYFWFALRPQV